MKGDINNFDIGQMIFDKLQEAFGGFKEVEFINFTQSDVGGGKRFVPGDNTKVPFESLMVTKMFDVEIRNLQDREKLDLSNSFVNTIMPHDSLPLPIYAVDVDVHKGKYVHVITDHILLSKNPDYLEKFDAPLKELRKKYEDLPGLVLKTPEEIYKIFPMMKEFESFASSGKIFGNIPIEHESRIIELIEDYLDLYCSLVKESDTIDLLKRDDIKQDATEGKKKFKDMMARMDFSDDMPNMPKKD